MYQAGIDIQNLVSLHLHPYFIYVRNKGSGESVHYHSINQAFVAKYDKYENDVLCWPTYHRKLICFFIIDL